MVSNYVSTAIRPDSFSIQLRFDCDSTAVRRPTLLLSYTPTCCCCCTVA